MSEKLLEAGKIVNTHGIRGEVKIQPWCDGPEFLHGFKEFYIDDSPVRVLNTRIQKGCVIAALDGVDNLDAAILLKNKIIKIDASEVELEDGQYFITDIVGLAVVDDDTGEELGHITDVMQLPANDVYVVDTQPEMLIPVVDEFIKAVDLERGTVRVHRIEGM